MARQSLSQMPQGTRLESAKRFFLDRHGVAAIEFAFMVPILICLYFGSMEVSQAIETNKKVGRISSMVGDLVTQEPSVNANMLRDIMQIGAATIKPYARSRPTIKVTAIMLTDEVTPKPIEVWWRSRTPVGESNYNLSGGKSTTKLANPDIPDELKLRNTFLVRVETSMEYELVLTYNKSDAFGFRFDRFFDGISMKETYYLRPRMTDKIDCDNCDVAG